MGSSFASSRPATCAEKKTKPMPLTAKLHHLKAILENRRRRDDRGAVRPVDNAPPINRTRFSFKGPRVDARAWRRRVLTARLNALLLLK